MYFLSLLDNNNPKYTIHPKKKEKSFMKHNVLYLYLALAAVTVLAKNTR